ncbi:Uncharacterised protein [Aedoeadaptatus ivorii]|uniref:YCII-related domain n=1 Tax=Aedoeadaptatus ivorii TaxID=54006 RepID=A0A448V2C6_9FIRM|nr:YciI family protein [Peptoniphilus ivorii]MDQ0508178.1 hypothetical protein [Peptoniphilus ivorii]VEJ35908.1 Uncharacterised protein [Peptoniphilus ivorii]
MKYYVVEGKFKTFEFDLKAEENAALFEKFAAFTDAAAAEGRLLCFGDKAHGVIGLVRGESLDELLSFFESDPLTLADVIEYRMTEIENIRLADDVSGFWRQ